MICFEKSADSVYFGQNGGQTTMNRKRKVDFFERLGITLIIFEVKPSIQKGSNGSAVNSQSIVTLSAKDNQKLSKILSKGFERPISWNEYKTKSENKNTKNEYKYFLELNFAGVNILFALIYLNRNNDVKRFNARKY